MSQLWLQVIHYHAEGCIETIWYVHELTFVFREDLEESQRPKVALCSTSGIMAKKNDTFFQWMPLLQWKVIDYHAGGCIETIRYVHKLTFILNEDLIEL